MISRGYVSEGYGPDGVAFCAAAPTGDFDARKSGPGVVRWFDFDVDDPAWHGPSGKNVGIDPGTRTTPTIDTTNKASGAGALRFDIPSQSDGNAAGAFFANFSSDLATQFGENTEFFVQWRQRFNQAFVDTYFKATDGSGQGGIKLANITTGDQPGRLFSSCTALDTVVQTYYQKRLVWAYNSCTGSGSHGAYAAFEEPYGPYDFKLQNGTAPYCLYSQQASGTGTTAGPNCFAWVSNEWMTFQMGITLGAHDNVKNEFVNSRVRLWGAREGQPSQLLIDWKPGINGYFPLTAGLLADNEKFGKIYLLPYMTNLDPTQVHGLAQTWYDELIISTQRIADPASTTTTPVSTGSFPAWRQGKPVGQFFGIPATANMSGVTTLSATIDVWNGLAAGPTTWWSAASSGHGVWQNAAFKIDLAADNPRWLMLNPGSPQSAVTNTSPYYLDGLPVSRHTYYTTQFISAAHARDNVDRVMLFTSFGTYGINGGPGTFGGGPQVDGFRVGDNKYDSAGTWTDAPHYVQIPAVAKHPTTDDVYVTGGYYCDKWTAATGTWQTIVLPQSTTPRLLAWDQLPSLVDASRNRLVGLSDGRPYYGPTIRLQFVDLATHAVSELPITGAITDVAAGSMLVHDEDGDRYLLFRADTATVRVYAINPISGVSTLLSSVAAPLYNIFGRVAYFKALGGVAYLPQYSSNILFMPTR
jgi:hypothetical protein